MELKDFFLTAITVGSKIERLQQETIIFLTFILNKFWMLQHMLHLFFCQS